jgi:hypothetical protein
LGHWAGLLARERKGKRHVGLARAEKKKRGEREGKGFVFF